ncbi:MAG: hypothetical protein KatS3mg111_4052 [Pirellulaceae bacterium]|nr:MAG: hypothetical protein KatS3mg111_4052 [Pirellulaceae bacterium]
MCGTGNESWSQPKKIAATKTAGKTARRSLPAAHTDVLSTEQRGQAASRWRYFSTRRRRVGRGILPTRRLRRIAPPGKPDWHPGDATARPNNPAARRAVSAIDAFITTHPQPVDCAAASKRMPRPKKREPHAAAREPGAGTRLQPSATRTPPPATLMPGPTAHRTNRSRRSKRRNQTALASPLMLKGSATDCNAGSAQGETARSAPW